MSEEQVTSKDGTPIVFDRFGTGRTVILVAGALQGRTTYRSLAERLAERFTVVNYDRRGRGDSGDTAPYAVEREIEDLDALISASGGAASVYGHSSGAGLVLHAAERGLRIDRFVLHEPPFGPDTPEQRQFEEEQGEEIRMLLTQDRRSEAIETFLSQTGLPEEVIAHVSQDPAMIANAPTLAYDPFEVMSPRSRAGLTPAEQARGVSIPGLVLTGGETLDWMVDAGREIASALANGRHQSLEGQGHVVPDEILAPALTEFFAESTNDH
ncbi:alpha/beta fold hydrolase [Phytoactinopolyspora halotolerans]|uniref:Alpha/beta hydrolase n=1 Tax=Phytoactinopolyspora halotolerans TaxID=1981512 RepID=A0A6L9S6R3_9ACTN|nr:alpha/beta hydrolase [Phytoactinopolyspora halotolerans]NED99679.1 alpha/beta hydrolase [Phytoactinopolyspora halotolerans]